LDLSPITRCVQLLQNLGKQIEKEAAQEEDMFEKYICWGKNVVDTKTASNTAAESRVEMLKQYLADIAAGRVEFTSERQDLEKEIEELMGDLEVAKSMRTQENKDFLVAKDEMDKAISALDKAIKVLAAATKEGADKKKMMLVKTSVEQGFAARAKEGESLNHALEITTKFLSTGDAFFLRRLLTGDVPKPDFKKLNRKATFKMKYKARSTKIQSVLAKLHGTFETNLKEATDKENSAEATYEKLKKTKEGQLEKTQASLAKMEKENGARGMSQADAKKEVSDLESQVQNDKKFIADTESAMATKTTEWKERKELRAGEVRAISQAVAILSSDDAKDNFKKSYKSQGFLFLQTSQSAALMTRATQQIQETARRTKDSRLLALVGGALRAGKFDAVIKSIDTMIATLQADEKKDLENKQNCESTRADDTREALLAGRDIDDKTDAITSLNGKIKELNKELDETTAELKAATDEINEAKKIRDAEHAEWKISDAEDDEASVTVGSAMEVLTKFYKDNKLMLAQQEPPPPPPATWDGAYKGKTGDSAGIIGILKICQEDIDKDRSTAKADEGKAQAAYDKARAAFETQEKALKKAIGSLEGEIGAAETEVEETTKARATKHGEMEATLTKIQNANPGCDYIEVNYPMRVQNRQIEIDGLLKAKAILQGAAFSKPDDPSREIKPGDALLQRLRRH